MTQRNLTGWSYAEILQGDTLQSIAARELNDASQWALLATINGLSPPYITGDPTQASASVKLYGQSIIIPGATPQASATVDPNAVFGVDVALTNGFMSAVGGDLISVAGQPNLSQALAGRIITDKRELLFHLDYGCKVRQILGAANGQTAALLGAQFVKSSLLADPRVQSVESVIATINGDSTDIVATIIPVSGAPITLSVTV